MNKFEIFIIIANIVLSLIFGILAIVVKTLMIKIIATILLILLVLIDFAISAFYMTLVYFRMRIVPEVNSYNRILFYVVLVFWILIVILVVGVIIVACLVIFASPEVAAAGAATEATATEAAASSSLGKNIPKYIETILLIVLVFCLIVNISTGVFCFVIAYMYSTTSPYYDDQNSGHITTINGVNNLILSGVISIITFIVIVIIFVIKLIISNWKKKAQASKNEQTPQNLQKIQTL